MTIDRTGTLRSARRWFDRPTLSISLAVGWLLLQQSLALTNLITAVVLGIVLPRLVHSFLGPGIRPSKPATVLRLFGVVVWDVLVSNVVVARIVLSPGARPRSAWIRVPLELRNPIAQVWLANIITNTPGTVSCKIDEDSHEIVVHVLDCDDGDALVAEIVNRYERPLKEIFE